MKTEIRANLKAPELRDDGNGSQVMTGYAALFNSQSDIGGQFYEQIARGAFTETIQKSDVRALFDHDSGRLLGRQSTGTLRLEEDERGLRVEVDLPDTSDGRDVAKLIERGDLDGMSFGFIVRHDEWDETSDPPSRTIHKVDLREVSAVAFPAYNDTSLALRSLEKAKEEKQKSEQEAEKKANSYFRRKAESESKFRRLGD